LRRSFGRRVIGDSRSHDDHVNLARALKHCGVHLRGAPHTDDLVDRGWIEGRGASHQRHLRATPHGFAGYRKSHAAARSVPDIADRIEILIGRAGSDKDPLPSKRSLRSEYGFGRCNYLVRFGETSLANPPAPGIALTWLGEPHAAGGQSGELGSDGAG